MPQKPNPATPNEDSRRPIAARNSSWAGGIARKLSGTGITPNQISFFSMVFGAAALGFYGLYASTDTTGLWATGWPLLCAALCIQMRLLCNLFDGMVALEGGKASGDGPFWNEFPDRIADIFIIVGAGLAAASLMLGWAAAALAVCVAYVRELGRANGLPADISGPMAKQHRMALLTLATLVSIFEPLWSQSAQILFYALWIVAIGSAITIIRRAVNQVKALKAKA